jgi:hypothetical protein
MSQRSTWTLNFLSTYILQVQDKDREALDGRVASEEETNHAKIALHRHCLNHELIKTGKTRQRKL